MQTEITQKFVVGDIVRLKCNFNVMMVNDTSTNPKNLSHLQVHVVWHNDIGLLCSAVLDERVLIKHVTED